MIVYSNPTGRPVPDLHPERPECGLVGIGQRVQVTLGRAKAAVPKPVPYYLEVRHRQQSGREHLSSRAEYLSLSGGGRRGYSPGW